MQSIRRDCYMMGWPRTSRVFLKWKSGGFLSSLISIGCICVLCCMAVFSCAISWPSFGCKQPYSSATHQAPSPFWRSHIALPRLKPSFVHANCDPSSLPLHDDRRASGPESRHGEAVKSDLPARPSAVGKRERKKSRLPILASCRFSSFLSWTRPSPTPPHGVVSLALGTVASWSWGELSAFSLSSAGR